MATVIQKSSKGVKLYPLGDFITADERTSLGLAGVRFNEQANSSNIGVSGNNTRKFFVRAITTGEVRPPRKGERYISGAQPEAWLAPNDLSSAEHIATVVVVEPKLIIDIVEYTPDA